MTIEEIKDKYGNDMGYVKCINCPCRSEEGQKYCSCNDGSSCNGYGDAHRAIQSYLNAIELTSKTTGDKVSHPAHYTNGGMECLDEMIMLFGKEVVAHFCLCNVWKYRYRALAKGGQEDIDKSHFYMKKYKELSGKQIGGAANE